MEFGDMLSGSKNMDRKEIALAYSFNKNWIAGSYYIENLVCALNLLDNSHKPIIRILCQDQREFSRISTVSQYADLKYQHYSPLNSKLKRLLCRFTNGLFGGISLPKTTSFVFPMKRGDVAKKRNKAIFWIEDFQEKYYPEYFSSKELEWRERTTWNIISKKYPIVFSSMDSKNDFDQFYPKNQNPKFVLHFAVQHPDFSSTNINLLRKKYCIKGDYYFCANQFWKHKNHLTLFQTVKILRECKQQIQLLCSGSPNDYRNPGYYSKVIQFLRENHLEENIHILGFLERHEQLCLMKHSKAVIQPSFFEGWSTVIEDCKALGKFAYVSDIPVHREQICQNACFFNPKDAMNLADKIQNVESVCRPIDYAENLKQFGRDFLAIMQEIEDVKQ
jgi:glycosyltransferase involved in cell wall biosynthesis